MHILYLHQYFTTPDRETHGSAGTRSYEFARRLVGKGHTVEMITSDCSPQADTPRGWYTTEEAGIRVHWLPVPYSNKKGFFTRVYAFLRFAIAAAFKAASLKGDIIFATSTPLTIALPALYARWRLRCPMVFEVRDLWPEAPRQLGVLTNPLLLYLAKRLEHTAYRKAAHIIGLSPGICEGIIATGISQEKVTLIPNASDLDHFHPDIDGSTHRKALPDDSSLVLFYFGALGLANGLDFVLDAAALLQKRRIDNIIFCLAGDGKEANHLQARVETEGLTQVQFLGTVSKKDIAKRIAACDVALTIFKNTPVLLETCSPNKFFDGLAAGKPILTNMRGWIADLVQEHDCGVVVEADNVDDFADKVVYLRDHRDRLAEMGARSRACAERYFSRDSLAGQLESVLLKVHAERR